MEAVNDAAVLAVQLASMLTFMCNAEFISSTGDVQCSLMP